MRASCHQLLNSQRMAVPAAGVGQVSLASVAKRDFVPLPPGLPCHGWCGGEVKRAPTCDVHGTWLVAETSPWIFKELCRDIGTLPFIIGTRPLIFGTLPLLFGTYEGTHITYEGSHI